MKKSYPDLRKEFDEKLTESAKLRKHVDSLANSIQKRALPLTYKKALTYLRKVVWSDLCGSWLLIEKVQLRKKDVRVETIAVSPSAMYCQMLHLTDPDEDFLKEKPSDFPEHFQAFVMAAMKNCAKYYRQYNEERNARSTSTTANATSGTGSDKASQK